MKKQFALIASLAITAISLSQRNVFKYPAEFTKGTLQARDYDSYYLNDPVSQNSVLVLKDNKKAEYLLLDKNLKLVSKFSPPDGLSGTIFKMDESYAGGTAGDGKFYFVYEITQGRKSSVYLETVDPAAKTVSNRELFDIPKEENSVAVFGGYGKFFCVTSNNDTDELVFYTLNSAGGSLRKTVKLNIPAGSRKKKISDFLDGMKVISSSEEPGLETATEKVKLFHSPGNISIVVNEGDNPVYLLDINTETFTSGEKMIDQSALTKEEKGKSYINSYLFGENLYSLVLNKKNIRIAINNTQTGALLKTHEINENSNLAGFASPPIIEERRGKRTDEKNIDEPKKLIKALDKGSEAIMMYKDKRGRIVISIGTYDMIPIQTGGSSGFSQHTYSSTPQAGASNVRQGQFYLVSYNAPGKPSYTTYSANFYKSVNFKLLLDPATLNFAKGAAPGSVADQIKDYLSDISKKAEAKNQFSLNDKEYFGYYDREMKMYFIEEIIIRK